jgi:cytochrome b
MPKKIRVWDLPTRLFHWSLLALVVAAFVSVKISGNAMVWHGRIGYAILVLLAFRLIWGVVGGHHSRFANFVKGPGTVLQYFAQLKSGKAPHGLGHNPMGALSVLALLASLLFQAVSGLFTNDDIAFEGPLAKFISNSSSMLLTKLHQWNEKILIAMIILHLAAILFYTFKKKQALIPAMISGDQDLPASAPTANPPSSRDSASTRLLALVILAVLTGILYWIGARIV